MVSTKLLVGAAAVAVLITGAIAQTTSRIERINDPSTQQNSERSTEAPKKKVRTVYPNTQNAEQAVRESKSATGRADASKPGDVTPLPNAQPQPSAPASVTQAPSIPNPPTKAASESAPTATAQQSNTPSQPAAQPAPQERSGIVALDTQQQTSIGQAIARHDVKPLANVAFSMAVGTKVPSPVQLRALPADVATFVPQYRGYSYFAVEEQVVIVNPGTQEIVAIVPYTGAAPATRTVDAAPAARAAETSTAKARETPPAKSRKHVARKPTVSRPVKLNTGEQAVTRGTVTEHRRHSTEQRDATRSVRRQEYRERAPRAVTVEEYDEPVYREVAPRPRGFFGFFGGNADDDD